MTDDPGLKSGLNGKMGEDLSPDGEKPMDAFPRTQWTFLVQPAQQGQDGALAEILTRYYKPLEKYLMCQWRLTEDRAQDLLQGFIADKVLSKGLIALANRKKGKFRTFLLSSLKNYVIDQFRKLEQRQFFEEIGPDRDLQDPGGTASEMFDREWASQTVAQALEGMEAECRQKGRMDVWEMFQLRIVGPVLHGEPETPYEQLVTRFHLKSPSAAFNLLLTGKRMFERQLRRVIGSYVESEEEVTSEIRDLCGAFSMRGAR